MRSVRRLVAILSVAGLSALDSQAVFGQEGGFQVPLNTDPIIPTPTGQVGQPGFYTGPDFTMESRSEVFRRPARPSLRQPKAGEHLGGYLIAEQLPPRYELPPEPPQPTVTLLPPVPVTRAIEVLPLFGQPGYGKTLPKASKPASERAAIHFTGPAGMKVSWQLPDGSFKGEKDAPTTRQEYNFARGQVYRLRLAGVLKEKPGRAFYPTLEVAPTTAKTATFLKHASVPVSFTAEEFAKADAGTLIVKVIYLPDPVDSDFSAVVGAEEVVSTRLEPGTDPVAEAQRRGSVLAVIRLGNFDLDRESPAPGSGTGRIVPLSR